MRLNPPEPALHYFFREANRVAGHNEPRRRAADVSPAVYRRAKLVSLIHDRHSADRNWCDRDNPVDIRRGERPFDKVQDHLLPERHDEKRDSVAERVWVGKITMGRVVVNGSRPGAINDAKIPIV